MAIGEYIQESKGKVTALRVLENGKLEASYQASGKLLGVEVSEFYTAYYLSTTGRSSLYGREWNYHFKVRRF